MKKPSKTAAELEASIKVEMEDICDWPTDMTISVQPDGDSWKVAVMQEGSVDGADRRGTGGQNTAERRAGAARRTGRTLRSRAQVPALCRLSRTFYDRGVWTGYGGLGRLGKGKRRAALHPAGRFSRTGEGIQQQRVVASGAGGCGRGRDRV